MPALTTLPRYAPIGDMALWFHTGRQIATTTLDQGTITRESGFAVTFWMRPTDSEEGTRYPLAISSTPPGHLIFSVTHPMLLSARCKVPTVTTSTATSASVEAGVDWQMSMHPFVSDRGWAFTVGSYNHTRSEFTLAVMGKGPAEVRTIKGWVFPSSGPEPTLTVSVGQHPVAHENQRFRGAITRLRLWRTALTAEEAIAARFDQPLGPRTRYGDKLAADWRMCEGYGDTAFDHGPHGTHLRLGNGTPGSEPTWVVANIPVPVPAGGPPR